jgi:adenosine kinase
MSIDLLVVGQLSLDDLRSEHGEVRGQPGGAALYVSVAGALQGCRVALAAATGEDYPDARRLGLPAGVQVSGIRVKAGRSTRVRLCRRCGHVTDLSINYARGYVWPDEFGTEYVPRHLHLCAMPTAVTSVWKAHAEHLAVPFSLGLAAGLGESQTLGRLSRTEARNLVGGAELVFGNASEARILTGTAEVAGLAERIVGMRVQHAIVTNGASACQYASSAGDSFECDVPSAATVIDTTGAGDSVTGTVLGARLAGAGFRQSLNAGIACALRVISDFGINALLETTRSRDECSR